VEAARAEGVAVTAQLLRLDGKRLARQVEAEPESRRKEEATFVELRMGEPRGKSEATLELAGSDGERMRVVVSDVRALDVVGLVRAFWSRG
jgi:hypothetical protein